MIVVSNTSPLTNLAAIQQFDLLRALYQQIHISRGVWSEMNAQGKSWPGRNEVADASWVTHHQVADEALVIALMLQLDRGEAETIALALQLGANLVLMDETDGRRIAKRLGLQVVGVLGILLEAKHHKLVDAVLPQVDMLRHAAGFYVNSNVYQMVRQLANE